MGFPRLSTFFAIFVLDGPGARESIQSLQNRKVGNVVELLRTLPTFNHVHILEISESSVFSFDGVRIRVES